MRLLESEEYKLPVDGAIGPRTSSALLRWLNSAAAQLGPFEEVCFGVLSGLRVYGLKQRRSWGSSLWRRNARTRKWGR